MMPEERYKREVISPVSDSDDSSNTTNHRSHNNNNNNNHHHHHNNHNRYHHNDGTTTKEKKFNGLLAAKSASEQLTLSERELIEREFLEARRVALERAQNDLLAGLPLAAVGLPFLPSHHPLFASFHQQAEPLSLKMTSGGGGGSSGGNRSHAIPSSLSNGGGAFIKHNNNNNKNLPSGSSGISGGGSSSSAAAIRNGGGGGGIGSPANSTATSGEPEDLSFRATPKDDDGECEGDEEEIEAAASAMSPKDLTIGDGGHSRGSSSNEDAGDICCSPPATNADDGGGIGGGGGSGTGSSSQAQNWSFEEQFKQLYELSDDSKRKEFLDDLFSYMQKRGTPVTRIPIMAKQVLDLYQLYKLVVAHGGLVEVINKKLWREITKGLNLPPSITSAAFTLRTQYMKFLYPFECEREKLSLPGELQAAIDGNRREGRRAGTGTGYNPYSQISPTLLARGAGGGGGQINGGGGGSTSANAAAGGNAGGPLAITTGGGGGGALTPDEDSILGGLATPTSLARHPAFAAAYREHMVLEAQRQLERSQINFSSSEPGSAVHNRANKSGGGLLRNGGGGGDSDDDDGSCSSPPAKKQATGGGGLSISSTSAAAAADEQAAAAIASSTAAAFAASAQERLLALGGLCIPSAHFKITGRGDGRSTVDSSLVVSMEINGVMYQGVLFAQPNSSRLAGPAAGN